MNTVLMYKGYTGRIEIDLDADILFGRVIDIIDVITFQGNTIVEARQAFQESIDDYLSYCEELGQEPERPFSGKISFRTTPDRHRHIFVAAALLGKSVNAWVDTVLSEAAERTIQEYTQPTATTTASSHPTVTVIKL